MNSFLTKEQVAKMLNMAPDTIRKKTKSKEIPHYRIGNALRFDQKEIENWIKRLRVESIPISLIKR